jgi:hypothetical protein
LQVVSRHSGTLSKMVWVDVKTKLPLRQELYDAAGNLAAASEYREISFEASLPANLFTLPQEVRMGQRPLQPDVGDRMMAGVPVAQPRYVPQGYQLVSRMTVKQSGWEIGYLRWTDGLNTISLIEERGKPHRSDRGAARQKVAGFPAEGAAPQKASGFAGEGEAKPKRRSASEDANGSGMHCGNRLEWRRNGSRFVLMGNVSLTELKRMAESLEVGRQPSAVSHK